VYEVPYDKPNVCVNHDGHGQFSTGLHESSTPGQWVKIDLQANKPIRPNYYCMKGPGQIGHELKNWNLEGSNDNLNWDVLSKHVDFISWQGTISCVSFEIKDCHVKYRFFRVIATGKSYHDPYCFVSKFYIIFTNKLEGFGAFEIYGDI
jgi:hypothetical protein